MSLPTVASPTSLAIGDLNGDGRPDIAVTNFGDASMTLFMRNATGTGFTPTTITGLGDTFRGIGPTHVAIGSLRAAHDIGGQDLAVVINNDTLDLFLRDPSTAGNAVKTLDAGRNAQSVAIGDLGGDGLGSDLAVADTGPPEFQAAKVFLHDHKSPTGYTTMTLPAADPNYSGNSSVAIGDLGGPGRPGVAITSAAQDNFNGSVSAFVRDSTHGRFRLTTLPMPGSDVAPDDLAVGDLSGTGKPDLVTTNEFSADLSLFTNTTG